MHKSSQFKRSLSIIVFLLVIFVVAVTVWYAPTVFKGYSAYTFSIEPILGRNLSQTGLYSAEDSLNILLSSDLVLEQGQPSAVGNRLTALSYKQIFDWFGLLGINDLVLLSIIIHALTLVVFTALVLYLFDLKTSLIFSLVYIFLPFNWIMPYGLGFYEFALLFLSLFFFFYFYGLKKKYDYLYLILAGVFLSLATLSKEALLLIVPFLLIYLWFKQPKKYLTYLFIPFVVLLAIFWLPNIGHNAYFQFFSDQVSEENQSADFSYYGHVYPDPYVYHFEQEQYINGIKEKITSGRLDLAKEIDQTRELKNLGIQDIGLITRIKIGIALSVRHLFRFVSLEEIGGSLVLILLFLGAFSLKKDKKDLYQFFGWWIGSTIFLMSFVVLVGRSHLMDFNWAIALLITLGVLSLAKLLASYFNLEGKKYFYLFSLILIAVLYNFTTASHVTWSRIYDGSNNLQVEAYAQKINKLNLDADEVIVVNLFGEDFYALHYLTNKSLVPFSPETIERLLEKDELAQGLTKFRAKYVLGYSDQLVKEISEQAEVVNIATDSLEIDNLKISRNKGWLMNLVK